MKTDKLFGTDGIRGTPGEYPLTDGMLFKIGQAAAMFLLHKQQEKSPEIPRIIIGNDTRLSCHKLETILTNGITSCGVDVFSSGIISTPGLAFLTRRFKVNMGMMISASHNRAEDNGIKFFSGSGHKLTESEEQWIENIIFQSLMSSNAETPEKTSLVSRIKDGATQYTDFLKSSLPDLDLGGSKIVVDCGCGATSYFAPGLFREMKAEILSLGDQPDGTNINLGCGVLYPKNMAEMVTRNNADIGFAFDGDGDRLILSDEQGNILDGDYIMAIVGLHLLQQKRLPHDTVVATVMSNWGLEEAIQNAGGRLIRTAVGDKYVLEAMRKHGFTFGGEQSGHIIFLEHATTGDALLTALWVLKIVKETGKKLSQLSQCMCKLPQLLINVRVKEKLHFDSISGISHAISHSNNRLRNNGRLLVRYSGTEPVARVMVEGKSQQLIEDVANFVAETIRKNLGDVPPGDTMEKQCAE